MARPIPTVFARVAGVTLLLIGGTGAARADAIDGNWCAGSKRMSIRGPEIVTPGGAALRGDYTRHFFSYVIPAGEPDAGATMSIQLRGEHLAHARTGDSAAIVEWRRCSADVS